MTTIWMLMIIAIIVTGVFFVGFIIGRASSKIDGILMINEVDEVKTRWIFDMRITPEMLKEKKYVHFKVMEQK